LSARCQERVKIEESVLRCAAPETRLHESPDEVPAAIEVRTGDDLRNLRDNAQDALALAAGVDVAPGGDKGRAGSVPELREPRELDAFLLVVDRSRENP